MESSRENLMILTANQISRWGRFVRGFWFNVSAPRLTRIGIKPPLPMWMLYERIGLVTRLRIAISCFFLLMGGIHTFASGNSYAEQMASPLFDGRQWVRSGPTTTNRESRWIALSEHDVYEVVPSRLITAVVRDLARKRFIPLTRDAAEYYTGHYYRCDSAKNPYLFRAVYAQGATGGYSVFTRADVVLVSHSGLGPDITAYHKSALVVNLSFSPKDAYAEALAAQ